MKKVTISDVARKAGVSRTTVSYVLNGKGKISSEVVERVRSVMKRTGYKPRARSARPGDGGLPNITAGAVALIFPAVDMARLRASWGGEYVDLILHGCEMKLREHGLKMVVVRMQSDGLPEEAAARNVDGLIAVATSGPDAADQPAVELFGPGRGEVDIVTPDDPRIGVIAAECLLERKCRRVVFANAQAHHVAFAIRKETFTRRLAEAGVDVRAVEVEVGGEGAEPAEDLLLREVLKGRRKPDGVYIPGSDADVLALYTGLLAAGVHPARDLSFVCCLNSGMHLQSLKSAMCIDIRVEDQARMAVDTLLWRLRNRAAPPVRVMVAARMWR